MINHSIIFLLAMVMIATAQQAPVVPQPVSQAGHVKYKNRWYIHGGTTGLTRDTSSTLGQFFALDLSKSWRSTSPAWIPLPEGPNKLNHGVAISLDGKVLLASPGFGFEVHRFSFETNAWSQSKTSFGTRMDDESAVTLGTDGTVLLVGAKRDYDLYSFVTDQTVTAPLPGTVVDGIPIMPGARGYKVVWSEPLKSAVFFGGYGGTVKSNGTVTFYNAEKKTWSTKRTTGVINEMTAEHCMAITDDGKSILSYGGMYTSAGLDVFSSKLYILNLTSNVWTEGADSSSKRGLAACTVAGDYFLLWGGRNKIEGNSTVIDAGKPSTPVAIYHIPLNAWVQEYKPSGDYLNTVSSTPSASATGTAPTSSSSPKPSENTTKDGGSSTNIGAIAGGAGGAVVVVALVGFLVWRRKKQGAKQSRQHASTLETDQHSATIDKSDNRREHGARRMPQAIPPMDAYQPSQHTYDPNYAADVGNDSQHNSRHGYMYTTKHNTQPRAPAPHYPSWGASFGESYASDTSEHKTDLTPHPPSSPTSPYDYIPPPPAVSHSRSRKPREPQELGYKHMGREHLYAPDGRRVEERPGPQWRSG